MGKIYTAIGLMSGTSMDGIDAAIIKTDGEDHMERLETGALCVEYSKTQRQILATACDAMRTNTEIAKNIDIATTMISEKHGAVVKELLNGSHLDRAQIDMIGFHGHTVMHRPDQGETCQIGDAGWLASDTGIPVVSDLRQADIEAGGQGAPLVPIYHQALVHQAGLELPVAVLNVGGCCQCHLYRYEWRASGFRYRPRQCAH